MRTAIQPFAGRHTLPNSILIGVVLLCVQGCGIEQTELTHTITILLPDGATQEISPPTICLGITPPESAWEALPGPLLPPPPEPESQDIPDDTASGGEQGNGHGDRNPDDETDPPGAEEEIDEPDPCVETPGICIGAPPPYDWQLEDFQPLSCGYGAVYGLPAMQQNVTFVVLLAAW